MKTDEHHDYHDAVEFVWHIHVRAELEAASIQHVRRFACMPMLYEYAQACQMCPGYTVHLPDESSPCTSRVLAGLAYSKLGLPDLELPRNAWPDTQICICSNLHADLRNHLAHASTLSPQALPLTANSAARHVRACLCLQSRLWISHASALALTGLCFLPESEFNTSLMHLQADFT